MTIDVSVLRSSDPAALAALAALLPQLSATAPPLELSQLDAVLGLPTHTVLLARDSDHIVGTLTLVVFPTISGVRAWIEDVIVDEASRGSGVGEALVRAALACARDRGARTVDLTSRPDRESANRLYQRLGFTERATNVYRHELAARPLGGGS